jgi:molybdopterin/thiamine biosynthesis adenylyltransferase
VTPPLAWSRVDASARSLGHEAPDAGRFTGKRVLLTGEAGVLERPNGRMCLLSSLRLLLRVSGDVTVAIPAGLDALELECRTLAASVSFGGGRVRFVAAAGRAVGDYAAVLNVGTRTRPREPWTVVHADGWLARVSSGSRDLPAPGGSANPISALAAACLGVGEVFKRLIQLRPERGALLDGLSWSLLTHQATEQDTGPALPSAIATDLVVVGAGAIGNGLVYLLSELPIRGSVSVVDPQVFGEENLGTCMLIGPDDVGTPKALFAERMLRGRLAARGYVEHLEAFANRLGREVSHPKIVLTGLDNIAARHAVQDLWPDLAIDGAIGTFLCQVGRHPFADDVGCLRCVFKEPPGEAADARGSWATGLSASRIAEPDTVVDMADVAAAAPERRDWLAGRLGRQVCSVVQEGIAAEISRSPQAGFAPSVPFVACLSACLVASELVKASAGWSTGVAPRMQLDFLRGPSSTILVQQGRRSGCVCVERRANIERLRESRVAPKVPSAP